ncbi:hypothetical protein K2Q16_00990 [Patescibacteria group bacterium]|nr:hypothetical protein [Patescibacteria group bacterium]
MNPTIADERLYQITDPAYRDYILSGDTTDLAIILGSTHNLDEQAVGVLENAIDLYLLWLLDATGLATFISRQCDLSLDDAAVLVAAIDLALPEDVLQAHAHPEAMLQAAPSPTIATEIAATEAALAHISTVRTMARDMEDLKSQAPQDNAIYKSSQDTIRPDSTQADTSRWGSGAQK